MTVLYTAKYTSISTLCALKFNDKMKTMKKNNRPVKRTERNDLLSIIYN